jgi:sugar phosphate isomerase/epimerase
MFKSLSLGMLKHSGGVADAVRLAVAHGFGGVDVSAKQLADYVAANGTGSVKSLLAANGLKPGVLGGLLPGKTGVDEAEWSAGMDALPGLAAKAQAEGFSCTTSVMLPFHDELPREECFALHLKRLGQACGLLADFGFRLAVEYVSQKTRRAGGAHEFLYDLKGTMKLVDAVGAPNLGILLDSFHWYCASESLADIEALDVERIVVVHLADAPDRPMDEQVAFERELPGNGVADLRGFCRTLAKMGYDGSVTCEPFQTFEGMTCDEALAQVSEAMDSVMA